MSALGILDDGPRRPIWLITLADVMLLLVGVLGAGKGFTIAQLSVVVNALIGIYWLHEPAPNTRAATLTLIGCVLATIGGIMLGNLQ